jgi:hypothetical protein
MQMAGTMFPLYFILSCSLTNKIAQNWKIQEEITEYVQLGNFTTLFEDNIWNWEDSVKIKNTLHKTWDGISQLVKQLATSWMISLQFLAGTEFLCLPLCSEYWLWSPPSLLSIGIGGSFPEGKVAIIWSLFSMEFNVYFSVRLESVVFKHGQFMFLFSGSSHNLQILCNHKSEKTIIRDTRY